MKIAYIDCFSGISGDMFLGALIDAGLPFEALKEALLTLPLEGYRLETAREDRHHLFGTRFLVNIDWEKQEKRDMADIKNIIRESSLSKNVKEKRFCSFRRTSMKPSI